LFQALLTAKLKFVRNGTQSIQRRAAIAQATQFPSEELMKKQFFLACTAMAVTLLSGSLAQAAPVISLSLQEDGIPALTASSSTGAVSMNNMNYYDFVLNTVSGLGSPLFAVPYLNLQTLNVSANNLSASHTLTIEITETGLTSTQAATQVNSAFAGILNGVSNETITSYYDPSNTAYGTGHQLSTISYNSTGSNSANLLAMMNVPVGSTFSETEVITATFQPTTGNPNGSDSLNSSAVLSATPEPASLALFGAGLLGLGVIRYRRTKKA
jgi:hypothetical protein